MKKKIIIGVFLLLISVTVIPTAVVAIDSYRYDMDPANADDLLRGFGVRLDIIIGGFLVLYESDLFYTVYYFLIKPKSKAKTILNILSHLSLLSLFFSEYYCDIFKEDVIAPLIVFCVYIALRIISFSVSMQKSPQEQ